MHFRNFNYSFSSLIACVADSDVFNQAETRVCFIFCFIYVNYWNTKVGAVSNCLKYGCLDSFLTCKEISVCKSLGFYKSATVCSDMSDFNSGNY